jgi:HD-GYP domain-containing protein (c-di-GMP phosphodiesterase class II)
MRKNNDLHSSKEGQQYSDNYLVEYDRPSNFATLQFLVSSEIADILLFRREPFSRSSQTCKIDSIANVARLAATAVHHPPLNKDLEKKYIQLVYSLVTIIDTCDTSTIYHGPRTGRIALLISHAMGLSKQECHDIHVAGTLHDIGKIGIPERILTKSGKLTPQEWHSMRQHPILGSQILTPISGFENIAPLVKSHHEKFNGRGYPYGLTGENIPLGGRILAIADAFTTMTDGRIYRQPLTLDEAITELKFCAGTHFDPTIIPAALEVVSQDKV